MNGAYSQGLKDDTQLTLPADTDILVTRTFAAPIDVVYEAITEPEHVRRWWAPKTRGEMLICEMDMRIGGRWRYLMRSHAGFEVGFSGEYREIEAPKRLVCTEIFDPFPDVVSLVSVSLESFGNSTRFRSLAQYPSKAVRDQVIASGMEGGMRESYIQLDQVVQALLQR